MSEGSDRPYNFSAGPAILPSEVFERTSEAVRRIGRPSDTGLEAKLSILELSHRGAAYDAVHQGALALCHDVLGIPRTHKVLFLQGGASLQFAMIPMNLRRADAPARYVETGTWSKKAIQESQGIGSTEVVATSAPTAYDRIPTIPQSEGDASYLHITTNNTVYGTEFAEIPESSAGTPLVVDMSSNIGSRPMALDRVGLGYAGAQKNLGPSGVTVVFVREDLLKREPPQPIPAILRYTTHAKAGSLYNTPNTFGILVLKLVLEWIRDGGGVAAAGERNARKAKKLYDVLDASALYRPHAQPGSRSTMNVVWTLGGSDPDTDVQTKRFLAAAEQAGMSGLKGHRSVGGCRASIYNAFPEAGVDTLCEFLREFERKA